MLVYVVDACNCLALYLVHQIHYLLHHNILIRDVTTTRSTTTASLIC